MPQIRVDQERCKGCELCNAACPQQIITMSKELNVKGYFYARVNQPSRCIGCRLCAIVCPDVAIEVDINAVQYILVDY